MEEIDLRDGRGRVIGHIYGARAEVYWRIYDGEPEITSVDVDILVYFETAKPDYEHLYESDPLYSVIRKRVENDWNEGRTSWEDPRKREDIFPYSETLRVRGVL